MKLLLALCMVVAGGPAYAQPKSDEIEAYRELLNQDLRLASVGYRLASANTPFCAKLSLNAGWVIHDIAQYPDHSTARAAFGFEQPIQIAAVVEGGPADQSGIVAGDSFVELAEKEIHWSTMVTGKMGYERMASFKYFFAEKWTAQPTLPLKLFQQDIEKNVKLVGKEICSTEFWVDSKTKIDAGADGEGVRVTLGAMAFTPDDEELAALVAHELAHNVLGHRARIDKVTNNKTRAILATEIEADKLSVWLMANAGFNPNAAIRFWERFGRRNGLEIFRAGTHLRWKDRVELMQTEIERMETTDKQYGLLPPPLLVRG